MFTNILSETLVELRKFAPEDGWDLPNPPAIDATLAEWRIFYLELFLLASQADNAMERIRLAAKRNQP